MSITTVTRPLSAGSITMLLSFFSRFSACCSSFVKLLSGIEADCTVEAILLLMLSLADSDKSRRRDRTASTLDTIVSVGIRLTNTIHLTLKMTPAQVVETSVTNNSSFQNYPHPDDHIIRTTDTPGFKPFTKTGNITNLLKSYDHTR